MKALKLLASFSTLLLMGASVYGAFHLVLSVEPFYGIIATFVLGAWLFECERMIQYLLTQEKESVE